MNDVIELSDSEDEFESPKKKPKFHIESDKCYIVIDDDDVKPESETKKPAEPEPTDLIKINLNNDKMMLTIEKNGDELFTENKSITHVLDPDPLVQNNQTETAQSQCDENKTEEDDNCSVKSDALLQDNNSNEVVSEDGIDNKSEPTDVERFINLCAKTIVDKNVLSVFERKVKSFRKLVANASDYVSSEKFKMFLKDNLEEVETMKSHALECFINVYNELQTASDKNVALGSDKESRFITKLENALEKIHKKIRKLEKQEVNFDEDDESSYIQYARYKERAAKIYEKYCELKKIDPHAGHITYNRLDFAKSNYTEFNKALNKKYKNNKIFPTYHDVDKILRRCVKENNMDLSEIQIVSEVKKCFEELGNLMQKRRQMDLQIVHNSYLETSQLRDPAEFDTELQTKLLNNKSTAQKKIKEICDLFVMKQDMGEEVVLSADSDASQQEDSSDE